MAEIYYKGQRINGVTHIGYDPASPDGDHEVITVREPNGQLIFYDEASTIDPKIFKKLNRRLERSKYIGKSNLLGKLRYRWAKKRGRVQGEIWWQSNGRAAGIAAYLKNKYNHKH
jgi:hypothetical protein